MVANFMDKLDFKFIVGYLMPVVIFISLLNLANFLPSESLFEYTININENAKMNGSIKDHSDSSQSGMASKIIQDLLGLSISCLIISILLNIFNIKLIYYLEGYDFLEKTFFRQFQLKKFLELKKKLDDIESDELLTYFRSNYPPNEELVLPTSFGNVIRAFENYSFEMYGLDAVAVWTRIYALVPTDLKETIRNSKCYLDFSINNIYLSAIFIIIYTINISKTGSTAVVLFFIFSFVFILINSSPTLCHRQRIGMNLVCLIMYSSLLLYINIFYLSWLAILAFFWAIVSYHFAIESAYTWGENVKTVFDLYRYDLLDKMGLEKPRTLDEERVCWEKIAHSFCYWTSLELERKHDPTYNLLLIDH